MPRHYWTLEEEEYLIENWGKTDPRTIAARLGITLTQVRTRASTVLRLGPYDAATGDLSAPTIYKAIRGAKPFCNPAKWLEAHGLRMTRRKNVTRVVYFASQEAVWRWMEQHRDLVNWERFRRGTLGKEPGWVAREREARLRDRGYYRFWTEEERAQLAQEIERGFTADEIAAAHRRSPDSIMHAVRDWKIRPDYRQQGRWSPEDKATMRRMLSWGRSAREIANAVNRPELAVKRRITDDQKPRTAGQQFYAAHLWTREEEERLLELQTAGYSAAEIGAAMGRTRSSVRSRIRKIAAEGLCG